MSVDSKPELLARLEAWAASFNDHRRQDPELIKIFDCHRDDLLQAVAFLRDAFALAQPAQQPGEPVAWQPTMREFITAGINKFKEHELREIVATFCKLPGIAPDLAAQNAALRERVADLIERLEGWSHGHKTMIVSETIDLLRALTKAGG